MHADIGSIDGAIRLRPGKDGAIRRGHPWVFDGAIAEVIGEPISGDAVEIVDSSGSFLAWAFYSAHSQIRARCLSRRRDDHPGEEMIHHRLHHAWHLRRHLGSRPEEGVRVVNAEGDGLPGLILDLYDTTASIQLHHPGVERYRELIRSFALEDLHATTVIDRSQRAARAREGLVQSQQVIAGDYDRHPVIMEHGVSYVVDARNGQKTGFYLDQRVNRGLIARVASARRVLDLYAHTGGFGLAALKSGAAHVTFVESGSAAVELLQENLALNRINQSQYAVVKGEVQDFLNGDHGEYDLIIVDPPPMARRKAHVGAAVRSMGWQLAEATRRAGPGALLMAFSCSHHVGRDALEAVAVSVAVETGRTLTVLKELASDLDHPVMAGHAEGRYLSGLMIEIGDRA